AGTGRIGTPVSVLRGAHRAHPLLSAVHFTRAAADLPLLPHLQSVRRRSVAAPRRGAGQLVGHPSVAAVPSLARRRRRSGAGPEAATGTRGTHAEFSEQFE